MAFDMPTTLDSSSDLVEQTNTTVTPNTLPASLESQSSFSTAISSPTPALVPLPPSPTDPVPALAATREPLRLPLQSQANMSILGPDWGAEDSEPTPSIPAPTMDPHAVRRPSRQEVAENVRTVKRVTSMMGLGGRLSPPDTPKVGSDEIIGASTSASTGTITNTGKQHVRRRSSIQEFLTGGEDGKRRSIMGLAWSPANILRRASDGEEVPSPTITISSPPVIHESTPAVTMLSTLPPRVSSKRSTPNLGRPNSHLPSPISIPSPFDPRYSSMGLRIQSPTSTSPHSPMHNQFIMPPMRRGSSMDPYPHAQGQPHPQVHSQWHAPPPRILSPPDSPRSFSSQSGRLSSPSTPSVRSSTPNLRSSFIKGKQEKPIPPEERRVSTLNLPPMTFTNTTAPRFARGNVRRSGVIMPTHVSSVSSGRHRPMSHLPSVSSLNTVNEMGMLGGGPARPRHSHLPAQAATLSALEGRPVYRRSSTNSLSSLNSSQSASSVANSTARAGAEEQETLETLVEASSHSREASTDLPVPQAAFMRVRQGSSSSTASSGSAQTSGDSQPDNASVPSLVIESDASTSPSSSDHSCPATPDLYVEQPMTILPPRVTSRSSVSHGDEAVEEVQDDDDAIEEVLAANDGYIKSLNARLHIDVRIAGTSRASVQPVEENMFAPAPVTVPATVVMPQSPIIVNPEEDDTELPYTRHQASESEGDEFGVLPMSTSSRIMATTPSMPTLRSSQSFSKRFFGLGMGIGGEKKMKSMQSMNELPPVPSMPSLASKGSIASLRSKWTRGARGKGQMKEVMVGEAMAVIAPGPVVSTLPLPLNDEQAPGRNAEGQVVETEFQEKIIKQKKSKFFGRLFGKKREVLV